MAPFDKAWNFATISVFGRSKQESVAGLPHDAVYVTVY